MNDNAIISVRQKGHVSYDRETRCIKVSRKSLYRQLLSTGTNQSMVGELIKLHLLADVNDITLINAKAGQ